MAKFIAGGARWTLLFIFIASAYGWQGGNGADFHSLIQAGNAALAQKRWEEASRAFQKAADINPSSAKAHEGLGIALSSQIMAENVRPSAEADLTERAENHLKQAVQLAPSSAVPLLQLARLEAFLAERETDANQRSERYRKAQQALKSVISLDPSKPRAYLELANLERDEFGPAIDRAAARFGKTKGPIPDINLRHALQAQYGPLINDAISNAEQASNMNADATKPPLLLSRLYRQRALLRETSDEYITDMHKAADWQRQFLAVGGHLDHSEAGKTR
jgi:tetratricopeptide (TPR) repeat protein